MKKEFAPFELSVKLKKLGFNEECFGYYTGDKKHLILRPNMTRKNEEDVQYVTAPLWQQAFPFILKLIYKNSRLFSIMRNSYFLNWTENGWEMDDKDLKITYETNEEILEKLIELCEKKIT